MQPSAVRSFAGLDLIRERADQRAVTDHASFNAGKAKLMEPAINAPHKLWRHIIGDVNDEIGALHMPLP